jgi:hypothetical protein
MEPMGCARAGAAREEKHAAKAKARTTVFKGSSRSSCRVRGGTPGM